MTKDFVLTDEDQKALYTILQVFVKYMPIHPVHIKFTENDYNLISSFFDKLAEPPFISKEEFDKVKAFVDYTVLSELK